MFYANLIIFSKASMADQSELSIINGMVFEGKKTAILSFKPIHDLIGWQCFIFHQLEKKYFRAGFTNRLWQRKRLIWRKKLLSVFT